ncbi:hypothetical protein V490_05637 [Pseudogymnoascus sp. VKM F-3557]|nr:hypothetical protein V490_05637 [Pseudogymnoascus sp. VKM F-3557]
MSHSSAGASNDSSTIPNALILQSFGAVTIEKTEIVRTTTVTKIAASQRSMSPASMSSARTARPLAALNRLATFDNFYLYVCNAEQEGNMELNRMEDVLYNQRSVGEEILAELAAAAIEDAHDVMELDGDSSEDEEGSSEVGYSGPGSSPGPGSSGSERFYEFEPEPEREDYSEGWVERLPRGDTALTRADWFRRLAWRTARQREMRQPPAPYYIPDKADDETDLLVRLQEPGTGEDQCVRYEIKGLPRFSDEDGEGDSNDGSEPATSSPPPPPSSGTGQQGGGEEERGQAQGNAPVAHMWPIGTFKSMARLSYSYSTFGGQSLSRWQPTARNMVMA